MSPNTLFRKGVGGTHFDEFGHYFGEFGNYFGEFGNYFNEFGNYFGEFGKCSVKLFFPSKLM